MTKLCLNLCCDDDSEEHKQSLPQVLSLHPRLKSDVAGSILLKEDGHLRLCDDLVFRVSDANFVVPGVGLDPDGQIGKPRLILDTDVDPVLGRLFSKYSDVVKLHKISIQGGNLRCSVKLVFSEAGSLARVLCFVRDVLKRGACDVGNQRGVPRKASGLVQDLLDACYDFFCSYITFYAFRVVDAVRLVTNDKDHQWDVDAKFFIRSIDGRSLLYDEASARVLTFLHEHRAVVRSMESRSNERFVAAVLKSIAALANDVRNHVLSDRSVAEHSHRNVVAAYSAGRVGLAESVINCIKRGEIASSSALVKEAVEILAIFQGFTGSRVYGREPDPTVPNALMDDLWYLTARYRFLWMDVDNGLSDDDLFHNLLVDSVYDQEGRALVLSCGAKGVTTLEDVREEFGPIFTGVFVRYEKLCWLGFFPVDQAKGIR
ncbi:hypothetical protein, partial [Candidatus Anaplasma sp. TIGMIC]|uniref:hypothetical protein n=1 Tax=Candidatus Anaplasma sp. TIGMIC TaxID=3020713 RepID=UPI00233079EF